MGAKQDNLVALLRLAKAQLTSKSLSYPKYTDIFSSGFAEEVFAVYQSLGGIQSNFPLNLRKWDLEVDGIPVELDEHLHFNRYRARTLQSKVYNLLPRFPNSEYKKFCIAYESDCIKAGSYGKKWTSDSCEVQFGGSAPAGDLSGNGSARWKQRAFYDFVKDLTPLVLSAPLVRISIWDTISVLSRKVMVGSALQRTEKDVAESLLNLIKERAE